MPTITLHVCGHGERAVKITHVFNGGYAGRDTAQTQAHIDELTGLGVPAPSRVPTLYPLSAAQASQTTHVQVPHRRTSGEAEWALVVPTDAATPEDYLVVAACDHTDRALEVHGVAWSKQSAPDVLGDVAWRWGDVADTFDDFSLRAWVRHGDDETLIQDGSPAQLLSPTYWIEEMGRSGMLAPGSLVMSGTIPMKHDVDQFAESWRVELVAPDGATSTVRYDLEVLAEPWE